MSIFTKITNLIPSVRAAREARQAAEQHAAMQQRAKQRYLSALREVKVDLAKERKITSPARPMASSDHGTILDMNMFNPVLYDTTSPSDYSEAPPPMTCFSSSNGGDFAGAGASGSWSSDSSSDSSSSSSSSDSSSSSSSDSSSSDSSSSSSSD